MYARPYVPRGQSRSIFVTAELEKSLKARGDREDGLRNEVRENPSLPDVLRLDGGR